MRRPRWWSGCARTFATPRTAASTPRSSASASTITRSRSWRRRDLPPARSNTAASLGGHLDGCRIGFDLGGSDRKVAAIIDGRVVWSEEIEWDPYHQTDPQYHWDGIMDSLRRAAEHLPHVDAIGGSAAGVYVANQVRFASLFRGVAPDAFEKRVRNMFIDLKRAWNGVPFDVVNDGDVTALLGSMSLPEGGVLGVALGTSTAGGYVTADGRITPWLNEIAFVPVDYRPDAPRDEWSGDLGCVRAVPVAAGGGSICSDRRRSRCRRRCRCRRASSTCRR